MHLSLETPRAVSEYLLDRSGTAMKSGDFDRFVTCYSLPHEVHTFDATRVLTTTADLQEFFQRVRLYYKRDDVTDIARRCVEASFQGEDTVLAVHEYRLLSGMRMVLDPFSVFSVIQRFDKTWRFSRCEYVIDKPAAFVAALGAVPSSQT